MNEPEKAVETTFDSSDSVIFIFEGGGDNTIQPRPPYIPRGWPPEARRQPPHLPPADTPPATNQP